MTAEVLILNKNGVAMAADSAVTIGTRKIYNSANKVFALSRSEPVGVMIYGSAQFMDVPWEALIKSFRKTVLRRTCYDTLDEYAKAFVAFVTTSALIPADNEKSYVRTFLEQQFGELLRALNDVADEHIKATGGISENDTKLLATRALKEWVAKNESIQVAPECSRRLAQAITRDHRFDMRGRAGDLIIPFGVRKALSDKFADLTLTKLTLRDAAFRRSGVVFTGYGNSDIFPSAIAWQISGRVSGFLRAKETARQAVTQQMHGCIMPFAQREMVDMFISGLEPTFRKAIDGGLQKIFENLPLALLKKHGIRASKRQVDGVTKDLDVLLKEFAAELQKIQKEKFENPVLTGVSALPIDELASMAESLVSLTSFKRKVTMVPESVGGPVDVAVISKGDGFIWIKRKHYFKPELNHQYFQSFRESDDA